MFNMIISGGARWVVEELVHGEGKRWSRHSNLINQYTLYRVVYLTAPPPKMSKCRPVSKFFQKKIEYPDCPPPKISKCQTGKENSDT